MAVLRYLVEHVGQVASKEDLFRTVWSDAVVSDATLTSSIQELRQALQDDARHPQFIETVHRRGFRFIGKVVRSKSKEQRVRSREQRARSKGQEVTIPYSSLTSSIQNSASTLVGREAELTQLHGWLEKAGNGKRQLIFVTGEPGIGKTSLLEVFVSSVGGNKK